MAGINLGAFLRRWFCLAMFAVLLFGDGASGQVSQEPQLKAVFVYNFSHFTDWPPGAFAEPSTPLVIGILGKDPFGPYLEDAVRGESVNGRPLVVQHFHRVEEIQNCQILFISDSEAKRLSEILAKLQGRSILTVSDMENFAPHGGMVRLLTVNNKMQLRINVDALHAANLTMSSKVLRVAEIVHSTNK